jgi:hypothetical protein
MLGDTQYIEMAPLLTDDDPDTAAEVDAPAEVVALVEAGRPTAVDWSLEDDIPVAADLPPDDDDLPFEDDGSDATIADPDPILPQIPFVRSHDDSGAAFEIDEVEALPDEFGGVLDLHEGASDFVRVAPVARREEQHPEDHAS